MAAPHVKKFEAPMDYPRARRPWLSSLMDSAERPGWLQWSGYAADDNDALLAVQNAASEIWPARYTLRHPIFSTADRVAKRLHDDGEDRKPHLLAAQYVDQAPRPSAGSDLSADAANRETARTLKSLLKPLLLIDPQINAAIQSGQPVSVEWIIHSAHYYTGQTRVSACISARSERGNEIELSLVNVLLALLFDELDCRPAGVQIEGSFRFPALSSGPLKPWRILKLASDRERVLDDPGAYLGKVLFRLHFKHRIMLAHRVAQVIREQRAAAR
ncbi:hypothetical protein [Bosea sp. 124]|uniref:hypothetical protein n=1 Tax=Bosea sp. 124 TaxID=2135642 RepID=UPI000D47B5F0|nr:hypothetical protein [Bosea sp. 124]PTM40606.1 hypothetical protein C8D03_2135 [Bosea sp. 124]